MSIAKLSRYVAVGLCVALFGLTGGCTKKPSQEELTKLEEARAAAESAERKLAELRTERETLEAQLQEKESELQQHQEERDELRQKMGQ